LLRSLGLEVVDVNREDGERAAAIWKQDGPLSLGDRLCLAVAARKRLPVVTAGALWKKPSIKGIEVELLRG
jgi:PIN domain nuclease of toxin-antitoxin system